MSTSVNHVTCIVSSTIKKKKKKTRFFSKVLSLVLSRETYFSSNIYIYIFLYSLVTNKNSYTSFDCQRAVVCLENQQYYRVTLDSRDD